MSNVFEITPSEIHFNDIQSGNVYSLSLSIRNISLSPTRIKLGRPQNPVFSVAQYSEQIVIAPGLTFTTTVTFDCTEDKNLEDSIILFSDDISLQATLAESTSHIKIFTHVPEPDIRFDNFIDFREVQVGVPHVRYIRIWNAGSKPGEFLFNMPPDSAIKFTPSQGQLLPLDDEGRLLLSYADSGDAEQAIAQTMKSPSRNVSSTMKTSGYDSPVGKQTVSTKVTASSHKPVSAMRIRVEFFSKKAISFHQTIECSCRSKEQNKIVTVQAVAVQQHLELALAETPHLSAENVNFGTIFYHEQKVMKLILSNHGPSPSSYSVSSQSKNISPIIAAPLQSISEKSTKPQPPSTNDPLQPANKRWRGSNKGGQKSPGKRIALDSPKSPAPEQSPFSGDQINPTTTNPRIREVISERHNKNHFKLNQMMGTLNPNETCEIVCTFAPPTLDNNFGFAHQERLEGEDVNELMQIEVPETGQKITFTILGKVITPSATVDKLDIDFGSCFLNDHLDDIIHITNYNEGLPVPVSFNKVPLFSVTPSSGKLYPKKPLEVLVTYKPTQLGVHETTLKLSLSSGAKVIPIHVRGNTLTPIPASDIVEEMTNPPIAVPSSGDPSETKKMVAAADDPSSNQTLIRRRKAMAKTSLVHTGGVTVSNPSDFQKRTGVTPGTLRSRDDFIQKPNFVDHNARSRSLSNSPINLQQALTQGSSKTANISTRMQVWESMHQQTVSNHKNASLSYLSATSMGNNNAQVNVILQQVEEKQKHKKMYNDFVTASRQERDLKKKAFKTGFVRTANHNAGENILYKTNYDPFNDLNLGLDSDQLDREAPEPLVPRQAEPLFLLNSGQSEVVMKPKLRPQLSDTMKLVKHKYKPNATTTIEQKEVRTPLNPNELSLLSVGTRNIDFGRVTVYSKSARSLNISNDIPANVLATLVINHPELALSSPVSQVIPPGAMAGFDIIFSSDIAQTFTGQIIVQINGSNVFNVALAADVIPISLELPVNEVSLSFSSSNINRCMCETFNITNPGNHPANFHWEMDTTMLVSAAGEDKPLEAIPPGPVIMQGSFIKEGEGIQPSQLIPVPLEQLLAEQVVPEEKDLDAPAQGTPLRLSQSIPKSSKINAADIRTLKCDCFFITPQMGTVPPYGTVPVTVTFDPTSAHVPQTNYSAFCFMHVDGGGDKNLRIFGEVSEGHAEFLEKQIDFGAFAVGSEITKHATLRNTCKSNVCFFVEQTDPSLSVVPLTGTIPIGGQILLAVTINASSSRRIAEKITVSIRGGVQQTVSVVAEALEPNVEIGEPAIDFGGVIVGNSRRRLLTLTNTGSIAAVLYADLTEQPQFKLIKHNIKKESTAAIDTQDMNSAGNTKGSGLGMPEGVRKLTQHEIMQARGTETEENEITPIAPSSIPVGIRRVLQRKMSKAPPEEKKDGRAQSRIRATPIEPPLETLSEIPDTGTYTEESDDDKKRKFPFTTKPSANDVWGKWNGVGAFDSHLKPLQGLVDLVGTNTETILMDAFSQPQLQSEEGKKALKNIQGLFPSHPSAGGGREERRRDEKKKEEKKTDQKTDRNLSRNTSFHTSRNNNDQGGNRKLTLSVEPEEDESLTAYRLDIKPNSILMCEVEYTADIHAYDFTLFFFLSASQSTTTTNALSRQITAKGVPARLSINRRTLDFGARVISTLPKPLHKLSVVLTNMEHNPLNWRLQTDGIAEVLDETIQISPSEGLLGNGQEAEIVFSFFPKEEAEYNLTIPLFLNDETSEYCDITVTALGIRQQLVFEPKELFFQPVPLGFTTRARLLIRNVGYELTDVQCQPSGDPALFPVKVLFLEGQQLTLNKQSIVVDVILTSKKPVSFSNYLLFFDSLANPFRVLVHGVVDNDILTTTAFLFANHRIIRSMQDSFDGVPFLKEDSHALEREQRAAMQALTEGTEIKSEMPSAAESPELSPRFDQQRASYLAPIYTGPFSLPCYPSSLNRVLLRYLNTSFLSSQISVWPESMIEQFGQPLWEVIEEVLGEKIPGRLYAEILQTLSLTGKTQGFISPTSPSRVPLSPTKAGARGFETNRQSLAQSQSPTKLQPRNNPKTTTPIVPEDDHSVDRPIVHPDRLQAILSHYSAILAFIREYGGHVSNLKPEYFLNWNDYARFVADVYVSSRFHYPIPDVNEILFAVQKSQETKETFAIVSNNAWTTLLLQIFKLFVLSKVTLKHFKALPGVVREEKSKEPSPEHPPLMSPSKPGSAGQTLPPPRTPGRMAPVSDLPKSPMGKTPKKDTRQPGGGSGGGINSEQLISQRSLSGIGNSTTYSVPEVLLLKWLSLHFYRSGARKPYCVGNFAADLSDGVVILNVIKVHCPFLQIKIQEQCRSSNDRLKNAASILAAMKQLGMETFVQETDIIHPDPRVMVLLVYSLYQILPYFIPSTKIEIPAASGIETTKTVELSNPTKRTLLYNIRLEGDPGFVLQTPTLTLESGKSGGVTVKVNPRFSSPIKTTLLFIPKIQGGGPIHPISMQLVTKVLNPPPSATYTVNTQLYGCAYCEVKVRNPFPHECVLSTKVTMANDLPSQPTAATTQQNPPHSPMGAGQTASVKSARNPQTTPHTTPRNAPEPARHDVIVLAEGADYCPFRLNSQQLTLTSGGTGTVQVRFQPITVGVQKCRIMFRDEDQGEFTVEIEGVSTIPSPSDSFLILAQADTQSLQEITFPAKNRQLEAIKADNSQLEKALYPLLPTPGNALKYTIETSSPYFTFQKDLQIVLDQGQGLKRAQSGSEIQKNESSGGRIRLPFTFRPKHPGEYNCRIVLRSSIDIRIFDIKGIAQSPGMEATLDLQTIARKTITQEIPISNPTLSEWVMRCTLTSTSATAGTGENCVFKGPAELRIGARSTGYYKLTFSPKKAIDASCDIAIVNTVPSSSSTPSTAADKFAFHIRGVADDPPADGHIEVDTVARQEQKKKVVVPLANAGMVNKYRVVCDLSSCSGEASFTAFPRPTEQGTPTLQSASPNLPVNTHGKVSPKFKKDSKTPPVTTPNLLSYNSATPAITNEYELTILSTHAGVEEGTLMFVTEDEEIVWFTIRINTSAPKVEETVNLRTKVRKPIALDLRLFNPSDTESILFTVKMKGKGLTGPTNFLLEPGDEDLYTLVYAPVFPTPPPLDAGSGAEDYGELGYIVFSNDIAGEFLYELHLTCDDIPTVTIPPLQCELGMCAMVTLNVENPLPIPIQLECYSSLPSVFTLTPLTPQHQRTLQTCEQQAIEATDNTVNPTLYTARVDALNLTGLSSKLVVQSGQSIAFICRYSPSQIDVVEDALVKVVSRDGGEWKWNVSAKGLTPTVLPPVDVIAQVQESTSRILSFTNPFSYPLLATLSLSAANTIPDFLQPSTVVSPSLSSPNSQPLSTSNTPSQPSPVRMDQEMFATAIKGNKQAGFFQILLKSVKNINIEPRSTLQVPVLFSPQHLLTTSCTLVVISYANPSNPLSEDSAFTEDNPLIWTQPVVGTSEMFFPQLPATYANRMDDHSKEGTMSDLSKTAGGTKDGQTKKGYVTLAISGQTGDEITKSFLLPLTGLNVTFKGMMSYVQRCAITHACDIPEHFIRYFNDMETIKRSNSFEDEQALAEFKEQESGSITEKDWKAFYELLSNILTISLDSADEHLLEEISIVSDISPPDDLALLSTTPLLPVTIRFRPLVFCARTRVNLLVKRKGSVGGGMWRFSVWTSASNAPDSIAGDITLTSLVNQRSETQLEIVSEAHKSQPFHCLFRSGASPEFMLTPRDGTFDANGKATITLVFAPIRYGGTRKCVVAVSTPSKQWLYVVKGELPPYNPPSGQSKVSTYRG
ncbi:putative Cilia- and flagella-associated protein 47 [Blattamonas nauphoetae]|uniref:Cilia- and flagella-associated protein 47 n=1 Tax=Blattamonas nauphoetae TaxID=2049346 RepID=A0ABQ9X185_9EUKA|nr:putative Cilia- and flagella-associated protein 47 [Blattamonas nauphoetae]